MDESSVQPAPERPLPQPSPPGARFLPPTALDDPRALQVLTTEHWSLLSGRSLVYNEAFARAGMFLTFLSATLVALGLVSTGTGFNRDFVVVAIAVLGVDLFVGLATLGRVVSATGEDIRFLQGMNRIRHAYHDAVPGLEPYFISSKHDDMPGVFAIYGAPGGSSTLGSILHGLTTVAGMISVVCAVLGGVLAGALTSLLAPSLAVAGAVGLGAAVLGMAASVRMMGRRIVGYASTMATLFPSHDASKPDPPPTGAREPG